MAQVTTLGVDSAKNGVCIHGVDAHGHVIVKKRLARQKVLPFVAQLPPCLIGMEASGRAHYWAREFTKLDVHFISSPPVKQRPACMAWADKRLVQSVEAEG
jgi:transposase